MKRKVLNPSKGTTKRADTEGSNACGTGVVGVDAIAVYLGIEGGTFFAILAGGGR
jgi:hypothetical protein